jgi:hypothetical protein
MIMIILLTYGKISIISQYINVYKKIKLIIVACKSGYLSDFSGYLMPHFHKHKQECELYNKKEREGITIVSEKIEDQDSRIIH